MPILNLTDLAVRSLKTEKKQEDFWEPGRPPKLGLRVTAHGLKTWVIRYEIDGRRRRYKLGTYPAKSLKEARSAARDLAGRIERGEDPQALREGRRKAETFKEVAELYLTRHAERNKAPASIVEDRRQLEKDLLPVWGHRKAADISRREVVNLLEDIVARGAPVMANRTLALVSRIFNFAIDQELLAVNPAARLRKPGGDEHSRERVLSEQEIRTLWPALDRLPPALASMYRLLLLTAQRPGEVRAMRWEDLSEELDGWWWTVPETVAKNRRSHRVPLSPQALAVIETLRPLSSSEWVLESWRKPGHHLQKANRSNATLVRRTGLPHFTPHDLRRTAATRMTSLGIARLVVDRILNHAEVGVSAIYDRSSYDAEKRQALARWGDVLESIVEGRQPANVVTMPR